MHTGTEVTGLMYEVRDGRIYNPEGCEINVSLHCNLTCRACSHLSPALHKSFVDPRVVRRDLGVLAAVYRARFVKLLGGEPLLHPNLPAVIDAVHESGVTERVTLCTNGLLLNRMDDSFWASVDEVEVSVYPEHAPAPAVLEVAAQKARAHGVRLEAVFISHFRESHSSFGTLDRALIGDIFETCKPAHVWRCHTVHEGHFFRCPQSTFIPLALGPAEQVFADGLALRPGNDLLDKLYTYLANPEPLRACRRCLGSVGRLLPHVQVRRRDWHVPQCAGTEDLLDRDFLGRLRLDPKADDGCVAHRSIICEGSARK